ncbi:hypothetical protein N7495_006253 [Penicillium taxi]|uniref:uncharacterized protein n=1 Tax=Penicillium taxi TaxID=168475 RepID=UPI002545409D|nr:uncharacterized protein N7495_006253 [Penicillium taxi]KAJ5894562.1 hypothetical protein N7495_006253 [Penicillium taxi]
MLFDSEAWSATWILCLTGKTVVITGASAGMGLEVTKQLLRFRASVILAVRNVAKGETCATSLRQDGRIKTHNPKPSITVMELDMDRYESVQKFAKQLREEVAVVHILILNAGISLLKLERSPSGHDRTTQLLPYLKEGSDKTGSPARISWVGSRALEMTSLEKKSPIKSDEGVLEHMDKADAFVPFQRYGDSKLLCVLFIYSLAPRLDPKKVIINMMCPGMVNTNMSDVLPIYLKFIVNMVKAVHARPVEVGGWIILNSALVVGPLSHGKFLMDKTISNPTAFIESSTGQEIQKTLWKEKIAEMSSLTILPAEFK